MYVYTKTRTSAMLLGITTIQRAINDSVIVVAASLSRQGLLELEDEAEKYVGDAVRCTCRQVMVT